MLRNYTPKCNKNYQRKYDEEKFWIAVKLLKEKDALFVKLKSNSTFRKLHFICICIKNYLGIFQKSYISQFWAILKDVFSYVCWRYVRIGVSLFKLPISVDLFQDYLNNLDRKVVQFHENMLWDEWSRSFLKQHKSLAVRFVENVATF